MSTGRHLEPVSRRLTNAKSPRQSILKAMQDEEDALQDELANTTLVVNSAKKRVKDNCLVQKLRVQVTEKWMDACVERERDQVDKMKNFLEREKIKAKTISEAHLRNQRVREARKLETQKENLIKQIQQKEKNDSSNYKRGIKPML